VVKRSRLTNTAKIIIGVGIFVIVLGGIFTIPSFGVNDQPDIGNVFDQYSIAESFVPFRTVGEPRVQTTSSGEVIEVSTDFSNAIDTLTASQFFEIVKEFPDVCTVKLLTTIVFDDGSKLRLSSGATSFSPIEVAPLFGLVTVGEGGQIQPIKEFQTVPLLTCDVIEASDALGGGRLGYIHQWLSGVNVNWEFIKADGTKGSVNTASGATFTSPRCTAVLFDDIGDLASTGLYTQAQIKEYSDTFGGGQTSIFIGSERALCAEDANGVRADPFIVTANEIESRIGATINDFDTTLNIRITAGTLILEIPFISEQLGEPFISRQGVDQFLSRQVLSFTVDKAEEPSGVPPIVGDIERRIVVESFNPVKIDIANLNANDRTVTMVVKLNSYDSAEGVPKIEVRKTLIGTTFLQPLTATINMKDAGVSGLSRLFEGQWIVSTGQSLGTYELKVQMASRLNDVNRLVEVVQSAEDAPSETPVNGQCKSGQELVQDLDGNNICVAECADNLIYDLGQNACAQVGVCAGDLKLITKEDGSKTCAKPPITEGMCDEDLIFNQNTEQCEAPTQTQTPPKNSCKENEQLVNTGGSTYSCIPEIPDIIKLLTPIACTDKIGFTEEGFCLPATIVGLFQNPIQIIYVGIAFIILIVVLKIISGAIRRQRGGILLNQ